MSDAATSKMEVEIFGSVYHVRGNGDGEYLQELAAVVDSKMREIADQVSSVDTARIAILAALNLSDELFQCRRGQEGERARIRDKAAELTRELDKVLVK